MSIETAFSRLWAPLSPVPLEAPWPFLARLCERNAVDFTFVRARVRGRRQGTGNAAQLGQVIHELGGVDPNRFVAEHAQAALGMARTAGPFATQPRSRPACTICHHGGQIDTYDHIRHNVCLECSTWIGPTTRAAEQHHVSQEAYDAELVYRNLVTEGYVDQPLWEFMSRIVCDSAFLCGGPQVTDEFTAATQSGTFTHGVHDLAALYPRVVRALQTMSDPALAEAISSRKRCDEARRTSLYDAFAWLPGDRWLICERIDTWVRNADSYGNTLDSE